MIIRLSHLQSGDSHGQQTFLAVSADKQTHNYDTKCYIYIYIYIYRERERERERERDREIEIDRQIDRQIDIDRCATSQFIDDLCAINNDDEFSKSFKCIYPGELELKLEQSGTHVTFLDLDIKTEKGIFVYKL